MSAVATAEDPEDLEALFDRMAAANRGNKPPCVTVTPATAGVNTSPAASQPTTELLSRIGRLTRTVHETLRELGFDSKLEQAAASMPDARERLAYVATLTERAALRVLNAADRARPVQDQLCSGATHLALRWRNVFAAQASVDEFKSLADATLAFLDDVPRQTQATNAQLMEIVMAQDFQDLTGQVIKRINDLAHHLEQELLVLLLQNTPADQRPAAGNHLLDGPVINATRAAGSATTQAQVDDLLESLGY
jgi:chemotaxis protein CheZ